MKLSDLKNGYKVKLRSGQILVYFEGVFYKTTPGKKNLAAVTTANHYCSNMTTMFFGTVDMDIMGVYDADDALIWIRNEDGEKLQRQIDKVVSVKRNLTQENIKLIELWEDYKESKLPKSEINWEKYNELFGKTIGR